VEHPANSGIKIIAFLEIEVECIDLTGQAEIAHF
jgi:hypothetical protein